MFKSFFKGTVAEEILDKFSEKTLIAKAFKGLKKL